MKHKLTFLLPVLLLLGLMFSVRWIAFGDASGATSWALMGNDVTNSRNQPAERIISADNVGTLKVKWVFQTNGGNVSATPTVAENAIYFPDWSGHLNAVNQADGTLLWSKRISDYDNVAGAISRVSPAIHGSDLILGDNENPKKPHTGANTIAVDRATGTLRWITRVDSHPAAVITGSPVVSGDVVYVGISSNEESLATDVAYACCSFRGSMVALDANTGTILWKTYTVPDNQGQPDGYSGGAIWQPAAIDTARGSLYVGTGNNYEAPEAVKACIASGSANCLAPDNYIDSALALDLNTGKVKWARMLQGVDVWTVSCIQRPTPSACPVPSSPDYDLSGSGPNLLPNIVGFGQKSGMYWALNPDNGAIVWSTNVGPGSTLGGIEWGTATDGTRIYAAITNSKNKPYELIDGTMTNAGAWSALDVATGKILWQTPDPAQGYAMGAVSVANGVVYAGSYSGNMHALDARSGKILWTADSGGSVLDGPSIANGVVYWGSGYSNLAQPPGIGNNRVFAFTVAR